MRVRPVLVRACADFSEEVEDRPSAGTDDRDSASRSEGKIPPTEPYLLRRAATLRPCRLASSFTNPDE
jgi:hypothetical protein